MEIQLSLILWTVICFALLMLVLQKLLFQPMLRMMDKRRLKIAEAHVRAEQLKQAREEQAARLEEARAQRRQEAERQAQEEIKRFETAAAAELAQINAAYEQELAEAAGSGEAQQVLAVLNGSMDDFVDTFTNKLIEG